MEKQFSFIPTLLLFVLSSQSLGIQKTLLCSPSPLPSPFPTGTVNEENMGVVRTTGNVAKALIASHALEGKNAGRKMR